MKKLFKLATLTSLLLALGSQAAMAETQGDKIGFVDTNFLMQNHPLMLEAQQKFAKFSQENEAKFGDESKALEAEEKKLIAERNKLAEKEKSIGSEDKKIAAEVQKFQKDQAALESAIKAKQAELDKNTRLSTKQKQAELDKAFSKRIADIQARGKNLEKIINKAKPLQDEFDAFQAKAAAFEKKVQEFQEKIAKANKESGGLDPQEVQQKVITNINDTLKKVAQEKGYTLIFPMAVSPVYAADEKADLTEAVLVAMGGKLPEPPKAVETEQPAAETKPAEAK